MSPQKPDQAISALNTVNSVSRCPGLNLTHTDGFLRNVSSVAALVGQWEVVRLRIDRLARPHTYTHTHTMALPIRRSVTGENV